MQASAVTYSNPRISYNYVHNHKLTPIRTPEERPLTKGPDTQVSNEHLILVYKTTHQQDHSY